MTLNCKWIGNNRVDWNIAELAEFVIVAELTEFVMQFVKGIC